jgi:hypothetical protein
MPMRAIFSRFLIPSRIISSKLEVSATADLYTAHGKAALVRLEAFRRFGECQAFLRLRPLTTGYAAGVWSRRPDFGLQSYASATSMCSCPRGWYSSGLPCITTVRCQHDAWASHRSSSLSQPWRSLPYRMSPATSVPSCLFHAI